MFMLALGGADGRGHKLSHWVGESAQLGGQLGRDFGRCGSTGRGIVQSAYMQRDRDQRKVDEIYGKDATKR